MINRVSLQVEKVELDRPRLDRAHGPLSAPLRWNLAADSLGVAQRVDPPAQVALFRLTTELNVAGEPAPLSLRVQHALEIELDSSVVADVTTAAVVPLYRDLLRALPRHIHVQHSMQILRYLSDLNVTPGGDFFSQLPTLLERLADNLRDDSMPSSD